MNIFITGGLGFIGKHLTKGFLDNGHAVTATGTRSETDAGGDVIDHDHFRYIQADTTKSGSWQKQVDDHEVVVNLAGANIFTRWSKKYKKKIYDSRIQTTRNLVSAISDDGETLLISASAPGYYGDSKDRKLTEESPPGNDFIAKLCQDWEKTAKTAEPKVKRVVTTRFGVVLGRGGGALEMMAPLFDKGMGRPLAGGKHWFPWIHIKDLVSAIFFIIENEDISGPVNVTSPKPVKNKEFAKALAQALDKSLHMSVPGFLVRSVVGELADTLLASYRMIPEKLNEKGFGFQFTEIDETLNNIIKQQEENGLTENKQVLETFSDLLED